MYDLLTRTLSQGLQALLPIAFALAWFRRSGASDDSTGLRWGLAAALPATLLATYLFQRSNRQSLVEVVFAVGALMLAGWFIRRVKRGIAGRKGNDAGLGPAGTSRRPAMPAAVALGAMVLIVRQTMEIGVAAAASLQMRAALPLAALAIGVGIAGLAAAIWLWIGRHLSERALAKTTLLFGVMFAAQAAFYAFHESAEAGLLPWSGMLHAATEPYGPDGLYGRYVSVVLFLAPLLMAMAARFSSDTSARGGYARTPRRLVAAVVGVAVLLIGGIEALSVMKRNPPASTADASAAPAAASVGMLAAGPHLLFRHTAIDRNYGRLGVAGMPDGPPPPRAEAAITCDRVAYAAGSGICLAADRGVFTRYEARLFDANLQVTHRVELAGSPTRTRVSPDGRVGAITVFARGAEHKYEGTSFSTRTTLLDMATGRELGELESFSTWRNGARFKAADFNFWGVTFARDSNVFYATLKSAGTTYLVRGDLAQRRLTVLGDNIECPALSPDNRRIGFKKRVRTGAGPWRFYVLDLDTGAQHPIAGEERSIDDQLEWLDDGHVLYGVQRPGRPASLDVWVAAVDGGSPSRVFLPNAESPVVVRR